VSASHQREEGSILVLTLGFFMVALLLVFAVVDASAVFLARRDLAGAADAAALDAADHPDTAEIYAGGLSADSPTLPLQPGEVQAAVARFAASYPAGWSFAATTPDGIHAVVSVRETLRLPVFGSVTVSATSEAESATAP
jgi:uncharacterized membrane protein